MNTTHTESGSLPPTATWTAAERLRDADQKLETAREALTVARSHFLQAPTLENEETVEDAERHVRRAERFRAAAAVALEQANAAEKLARRDEARAERQALLTDRVKIHQGFREKLAAIAALYSSLNELVAGLDTLVGEEATLCHRFNDLGAVAEERAKLTRITTEQLRLALNFQLGETWDDAPEVSRDTNFEEARKALVRLDAPGSPADFYRILQTALAEAEHTVGATPLCRWLATLHAPVWNDHGPAAQRTKQAAELAASLKGAT